MRRAASFVAAFAGALAPVGCGGTAVLSEVECDLVCQLRSEADKLRIELKTAEMRLESMRERAKAAEQGARRLSGLLRGSGVRVSPRGAAVVVAMADRVLFCSGEAAVRASAREELARLGAVLREQFPGRPVSVEGHCDSVPPSRTSCRYPTNWELSAARAVAVARILSEEGGLPPEFVSAAAFGDTRPVADNSTAEGRAKNRRVEIVVQPPIGVRKVAGDFFE
jgi:chemotaxis protein MotB